VGAVEASEGKGDPVLGLASLGATVGEEEVCEVAWGGLLGAWASVA